MNLIKRFGLRMNSANVQSVRTVYNEMQPYEEVEPRYTKNRRFGYRSRYHERGEGDALNRNFAFNRPNLKS